MARDNQTFRAQVQCLETMNFGQPGRGSHGDWPLGIDEARPLFKAAIVETGRLVSLSNDVSVGLELAARRAIEIPPSIRSHLKHRLAPDLA